MPVPDRLHGFFQDYLYASSEMHGKAFLVPCSGLGLGSEPDWGAYSLAIRARDTNELTSANYGTFTCPEVRQVLLPLLLRH